MIQTKEYDKISGKKELKKLEISNLPNKVFKVMFIKVLTKLERKTKTNQNLVTLWKMDGYGVSYKAGRNFKRTSQ